MRILIVEDEAPLANGLKFNFEQEGYSVTLADDGQAAAERFAEADPPFDLVILDLMLPGMSGYDCCRRIRAVNATVPILVLSARTLSEDKKEAFDVGTDQYMTKPFALPELLSRVRNLLDRHAGSSTAPTETSAEKAGNDTYQFNNVHIDFGKFEVTVGETTHSLTTMEQQFLRYLVEHEGEVLPRWQILRDVWGEPAEITTRTIDNFVMRLRRILEAHPTEPRHIRSVRGTGYRFVAAAEDE